METLFSKIISGEVSSYKVAEDDYCLAFLDINPNTKGHVLCVPKIAVDKFFDLPELTYNQLMSFVQRLRPKLRRVLVNHGERSKSENLAMNIRRTYKLAAHYPQIQEAIKLF